ncbi:MAG: hypothetical protein DMF95_01655 [Acidobacteria bacterium]|nr:MAG: hypothetical protein DMF96_10525 [Acidobacteriota bacterium]PYR17270.1 MAG: hypothetical protein DMF94_24230 [Acidobacteriota bacterium]PYR54054.1 MAG: hypothetical protein DMF95_01655 [Acidobacteriota bacterium]
MKVTRRQFVKGGVAAFTVTYAAPEFLSDLALAQGAHVRNLVVLYLSGGNDALSMLAPYNDPFYTSRRPTLAVPAGQVLQIGTDSSRVALGLHPRLTGMKQIFDQGRLAFIQRTGYENQSRSHFLGTDIWSTADPANSQAFGWVGRYLDSLPSPVDPLIGWNTTASLPHVLQGRTAVPAIASPSGYSFLSPNSGAELSAERATALRIASHVPIDRPELAFVYGSAQAALATLDRVATVSTYAGTLTGAQNYPANNGLAQALKAVAGAMVRGIGTKIFYVTTGGFDTHSAENVNVVGGAYYNLMGTLNDGLFAFYTDLKNQGLLEDTLVLSFSEFGRRINENSTGATAGTDHGAASVMIAMGGRVNGGLYGTAPDLNPDPKNPTLENNAADIHYETDFRSVYAQVLDGWLGTDSTKLLGGNFRKSGLGFI